MKRSEALEMVRELLLEQGWPIEMAEEVLRKVEKDRYPRPIRWEKEDNE